MPVSSSSIVTHGQPGPGNRPWIVIAVLSVAVAAGAARYVLLNPNITPPQFRQRVIAHDPWLLAHIAGGMIALGLGPFQFPQKFRTKHPAIHRWLGRVYLIAVLLGSLAGFRIALVAFGGLPSEFGFGILAVLWLLTAAMANGTARQLRFRLHRQWMIRNFALTFAAVTLRIWLPLFTVVFRWPFRPSYIAISWLAWVPNMLFAEWIVARSSGRTESKRFEDQTIKRTGSSGVA